MGSERRHMLTDKLWCSDHYSGLGVNGEILGSAEINDLELLGSSVLQYNILRLR